ncbi:hypothetical protein V8E55_002481 [Tylopilus felleus]
MGTVGSDRSFVVVHNQEISESASKHTEPDIVTPPPERAVADTGGDTDSESSLQSIDYFDATDLGPFTAFKNKIIGELANAHPRAKVALNDHHQSRKLGQICLQRIKEIYEFMVTEGEFDKIRLMQDVVASLAEQVVECTNFVEKYPYLACLWTRLDEDVLLQTEVTIQRYTDSLVAMLQGHAAPGTLTNADHALEDLDKLGGEGTGKSAIVHAVARWLKKARGWDHSSASTSPGRPPSPRTIVYDDRPRSGQLRPGTQISCGRRYTHGFRVASHGGHTVGVAEAGPETYKQNLVPILAL